MYQSRAYGKPSALLKKNTTVRNNFSNSLKEFRVWKHKNDFEMRCSCVSESECFWLVAGLSYERAATFILSSVSFNLVTHSDTRKIKPRSRRCYHFILLVLFYPCFLRRTCISRAKFSSFWDFFSYFRLSFVDENDRNLCWKLLTLRSTSCAHRGRDQTALSLYQNTIKTQDLK